MLAMDWRVVCSLGIGGLYACERLEGCVLSRDWRVVCSLEIGGLYAR